MACFSVAFLLATAIRLTAASPAPLRSVPFDWDKTKYLIAFGDSYTYVQGTAGHQNYSFIGDYLDRDFAYTPEQLLSDKIVQNFTGTAEGGPNWVEYLTNCGVKVGLTSPLSCQRQLWDFAFAGSDVSKDTPLHHNFTVPLVNQTAQYLLYGHPVLSPKLQLTAANTLVAIWIGINDVNDSGDYNVTFPDFYAFIISTLFASSVKPLHAAGFDYFLFVNLPPLDRTPGNVGKADPRPNATMVGWWNEELARQANAFERENKGTTALVYDANGFLNGVLDDPGTYGIVNTTAYCPGYLYADVLTDPVKYGCPTGIGEYFWFNSGHMTSHVHEVLAGDMGRLLEEQSS